MKFLEFLEKIRTPFWDKLFLALTYLGWETVFLILALVLIWCVNKKYGFFILYCGLLGQAVTQYLKMSCMVERPWVAHPDFKPVGEAMDEAGGFSFPSGHTQIATTTYGGLALLYRKRKALSAFFLTITFLVAFSRMYLGVHYPADVLFSLLFNGALVILFYLFGRKYSSDILSLFLRAFALVIMGALFVYSLLLSQTNALEVYLDSLEFASKMLGATMAFVLSWWIDDKYLDFKTEAKWYEQVIKVVLGAAILLLIKEGLKPILSAINMTAALADALRYFVVVFFAGTVWPCVFMKFVKRR